MRGAKEIAAAPRYALREARCIGSLLPPGLAAPDAQGLARIDLVEDGRVAEIAPAGAGVGAELPGLALAGAIVLPCFVDAHTHLDKGQIWARAPNADGTFDSALAAVAADREKNWNAEDVAARMEFGLRAAYAHGTRALRTHIDSVGAQTRISWPVFAALRERWRGRVELQGSPLFGVNLVADPAHMRDVEDMVEAHGSGILGAVAFMIPELQAALDALFALAARKGWDLDFHADETGDPEAVALGMIAETALERRFAGRILVGHCCSLSVQGEATFARTLDLVARAGLHVVSLPMCNMYLQDRQAQRTPRWRGVTALHELRAAGVPVLLASDNARDPFYAYGDLDMLETWREGARIAHLDHPVADWTSALFEAPGRATGLGSASFAKGAPADFILTGARSYGELFSRPQGDRLVLRAGRAIDAAPPPYSDLDHLQGLRP